MLSFFENYEYQAALSTILKLQKNYLDLKKEALVKTSIFFFFFHQHNSMLLLVSIESISILPPTHENTINQDKLRTSRYHKSKSF